MLAHPHWGPAKQHSAVSVITKHPLPGVQRHGDLQPRHHATVTIVVTPATKGTISAPASVTGTDWKRDDHPGRQQRERHRNQHPPGQIANANNGSGRARSPTRPLRVRSPRADTDGRGYT
jgi:hypothetical protein